MLLDHHRAKIVQPVMLARMLGPRPRAVTVVMCHGVFDVVHPGHLRHLLYAKSKAGVLVCSITSDRCADRKGPYRPHVPQDLRAANLAMLDIVNYVVICDAPGPSELLAKLQPDFYAKGFEYSTDQRMVGPLGEAAAIEAYGGEVIFTPGDVVYSSSALIAAAAPDLRWDKLAMVMERAELSFTDLRQIVEGMRGQRVHVVGDVIVDRLTRGEMVGWNGKTPTPSVRRDGSEDFVGGAGVVAKHAQAAGAMVRLTTITGLDDGGDFVQHDLAQAGVETDFILDHARPTTVKEVVEVEGYRLIKLDTVDSRPISDVVLREIEGCVEATGGGAIIFSDFRHGIFNARTVPVLAAAIRKGCLRVADSQVASRWGNVSDFVGFDLITPNEREARFALGDQDSGVRPLASRLYGAARCRWLLVKLGAHGVIGVEKFEHKPEEDHLSLDSLASAVRDPVGAGDSFLAYATLSLLVRPSLTAAAILGTMAAGVECSYVGNTPVKPEDVLAKIDEAEREIGR